MSDTPRTDAKCIANKRLSNLEAHNRMLDHARDLERELGEERIRSAAISVQETVDIVDSLSRISAALGLSEEDERDIAQVAIERLSYAELITHAARCALFAWTHDSFEEQRQAVLAIEAALAKNPTVSHPSGVGPDASGVTHGKDSGEGVKGPSDFVHETGNATCGACNGTGWVSAGFARPNIRCTACVHQSGTKSPTWEDGMESAAKLVDAERKYYKRQLDNGPAAGWMAKDRIQGVHDALLLVAKKIRDESGNGHQVNQLAPWCPRCERDYVQSGQGSSRWEHPFSESGCRYSGTAVTLRPVACNEPPTVNCYHFGRCVRGDSPEGVDAVRCRECPAIGREA